MSLRNIMMVVCVGFAFLLAPVIAEGGEGEFGVESFFDVFTELSAGPSQPIDLGVYAMPSGGGDEVPIEEMSLNFESVPPANLRIVPGDSGGGVGSLGADSFFDVFFDIEVPTGDSFFDVFVEIDVRPPAGSTAPRVLSDNPLDFGVDSFFDVFFDIEVFDVDPVQNLLTHAIHAEMAPGVTLTNVEVPPVEPGADSFFDVFVELDIPADGGWDPSMPVMHIDLRGSITPEPTTMAVLGLGLLAMIRRRGARA